MSSEGSDLRSVWNSSPVSDVQRRVGTGVDLLTSSLVRWITRL